VVSRLNRRSAQLIVFLAHPRCNGAVGHFGFAFKGALLPSAITVNRRIASDRDGIGRSFARHSSIACKYSS
jgi:hypothetical protein